MSWFADIAEKAETLLNKMDETAAGVLTTESSRSSSSVGHHPVVSEAQSYHSNRSQPQQQHSGGHSRSSSISSSFSTISTKELTGNGNGSKKEDDDEKLFEFLNSSTSTHQSKSPTDNKNDSGSIKENLGGDSLDKDKLISMSKEISSLTKRNIELETDIKRIKKKISSLQSQLDKSENDVREFLSKESDLKASLDVKDSQLGILRVRLEELDHNLESKEKLISELTLEKDALMKECKESDAGYDQNVEAIEKRTRELEGELLDEREARRLGETKWMMEVSRLEEKQQELLDELSSIQKSFRNEQRTRSLAEKELRTLNNNHTSLQSEYDEYKTRASKTLQSKDELIKALEKGESRDGESSGEESVKSVLESQCSALLAEVEELREKNEWMKKEMGRMREEELESARVEAKILGEELEEERSRRNEIEQEVFNNQEEINGLRDELKEVKRELKRRLNEREEEMERLRKQLVSKMSSSCGANKDAVEELEERVKKLTENLIQRQTIVEQLSSERHSLSLQLERVNNRLRQEEEERESSKLIPGSVAIGMLHSPSSVNNLVNRVRGLVEENPEDGQVTRKVKRAYSQLDRFSIRLGMFLRAYPSARAFMMIYVLILHVWVFFILFTYRPEIHNV